jgi:hypothetical protein
VARDLREQVRDDGFAFVPGLRQRALLPVAPADWSAFAASWGDLPLDMQSAGWASVSPPPPRHAVGSAGESVARLERHQPHYQGLEYNKLVGGIERWFEPIDPALLEGPTFRGVFAFCLDFFGALRPIRRGTSSATSSASRRARTPKGCPPPRESTATAWTTCW